MSRNNPKSYRLPAVTVQQLEELSRTLGTSQAGVITLAVDRLYQKETSDERVS